MNDNQTQLQKMRPTALFAFGGAGFETMRRLKAKLIDSYGDEWEEKIVIRAFDTTSEPTSVTGDGGQMVTLEPDNEWHNIGDVSIGGICRNLDRNPAINGRVGDVLLRQPATTLRHGAKATRPLGLTAFLWHYPTIRQEMEAVLWRLAGRDIDAEGAAIQSGINIIIAVGFGGGTGSGAFIDAAITCRDICNELGVQGEFSQITLVGYLPQAYMGINSPHLKSNTGAALRELEYLMMSNQPFRATYPGGHTVEMYEPPFDLCYVIDGVDEKGNTWRSFKQLADMVAQSLFLQIGTQVGRKGENEFDNLDTVVIGQTEEGEGTYLASMGIGIIEFPAPKVQLLFADRLLQQVLQRLLRETDAADEDSVSEDASTLMLPLLSEQGRPRLLHDPVSDTVIEALLYLPDSVRDMRAAEAADMAVNIVRGFGNRLDNDYKRTIAHNITRFVAQEQMRLTAWLNTYLLSRERNLPTVAAVIEAVRTTLSAHVTSNRTTTKTLTQQIETAALHLTEREQALYGTASSFSLLGGRKARMDKALKQYVAAANNLFGLRLEKMVCRAESTLWTQLMTDCSAHNEAIRQLGDRLRGINQQLTADLPQRTEAVGKEGVARISLATEAYIETLYQRYAPSQIDLKSACQLDEPLALTHLPTAALHTQLQRAMHTIFDPIRAVTVEQAMRDQEDVMSAAARRAQLFRLAAPSWNVNRTRLMGGGTGLARIEVMGVPNDKETMFDNEEMIVSTFDPYTVTALVVAAGAPLSALQQYDQYERDVEAKKRQRSLFVLPAFMADGKRAKLAFALGSIYGIVYTNGAWFYYKPAATLARPHKLAQGLDNAIAAFGNQDDLVEETMERIDGHIAKQGLQAAIQQLTAYCNNLPHNVDDTTRELKMAVHEYAEQLKAMQAFNGGLFNQTPETVEQNGLLLG